MEIKKKNNNNIHYKLIEELGQKLPTPPVHLISTPTTANRQRTEEQTMIYKKLQ
jgi:hypothetical protein